MIRKTFRQMLTAQILSAMTVMLCMLVDSIMIGRFLGVDSVAAYGLSNPVLLVFAAYGSMLSAGIQVLCGKTMGAGDRDATDACYTVALVLGIGVSVIGMVLILLFASPVCTLLGAGKAGPDNPVFFLTRDYLRGFIIGAPAFIIAQIMVPFLQISGNRTRLAAAVLLMTVNPGFAGQKLVQQTLRKISDLKDMLIRRGYENIEIEVDGNVSFENALRMRRAGADIFVAGSSSIFGAGDFDENIARLREAIK